MKFLPCKSQEMMNYLRDHDQEVIANLIFSLFLSLVLKFQFQEESLMGLDSVAQHPLPSETVPWLSVRDDLT